MTKNKRNATLWKLDGQLPDPPYWELSGCPDVARVFETAFASFPSDHSLIIEQSWPQPGISAVLEPIATTVTPSDTTWKAVRYVIPLGREMPESLRQLVKGHAGPEYCANAFVTDPAQPVLLWFDFPDEPIVLHPDISETVLRKLVEKTGLMVTERK